MYVFLISFLPLVFVLFSLTAKDKNYFASGIWGFFAGILNTFFAVIFTRNHYIFKFSLIENTFYFLLNEYLFPCIVWVILYILITKDDLFFKFKSVFIFEIGFYSIYLPYFVIFSGNISFSFYELFLKPVIVLSMILITKILLDLSVKLIKDKKIKCSAVLIFPLILNSLIPSFLEAMWIEKTYTVILMIVMFVYCAFGILINLYNNRKFFSEMTDF